MFRSAVSKLKSAKLNTFKRFSSDAASQAPTNYAPGVQIMHWLSGGSMAACVALVLLAQNTKDKEAKGNYMFYHKSCGSLAFLLIFPRVALRLINKAPGHIPGAHVLEKLGATASHYALYGLALFLPISGVTMGYFGGNGLPFFYKTFPSPPKEERKPDLAKQAYTYHKLAGQALEYLVPLHIAGAVWHATVRGHTIFPRVLSVFGIGKK